MCEAEEFDSHGVSNVTTQRIPTDDPSVGDSGLGGFNQPLGLD
jgi:hypothetical protein